MSGQRAIDAWWRTLDSSGREEALALPAGGPLTAGLAAGLTAAGVPVPAVAVGWDLDGRVVCRTVLVQPRAVADYLAQVRAAAASGLPEGLELAS
ncbi:hypothetical protein GTR02_18320 [Kineococcus sp. R8]|uniref:hypothetical protein n=1 Tax=Kineococcus siccus TaxID=2696567 RepID=UPI00141378B5|nr:hypothetical protein [Kineococcus siccus]NAZ83772.1 hypothetical protein [Kineococcus siccus]